MKLDTEHITALLTSSLYDATHQSHLLFSAQLNRYGRLDQLISPCNSSISSSASLIAQYFSFVSLCFILLPKSLEENLYQFFFYIYPLSLEDNNLLLLCASCCLFLIMLIYRRSCFLFFFARVHLSLSLFFLTHLVRVSAGILFFFYDFFQKTLTKYLFFKHSSLDLCPKKALSHLRQIRYRFWKIFRTVGQQQP